MEQTTVAPSLLGDSAAIERVRHEIRILGAVDTSVLIEGETGTGKTLVARALHAASRRRDGPFVSSAALDMRSASALVGHQPFAEGRRASGGAGTGRIGVFDAAHGGTLLLEEIGDMPRRAQAALLRMLEAPETKGVDALAPWPPDVRVLATTHRRLDRDVAEGRFRRDLFYRIRVARIVLPPLRQRPQDIPVLALAFLRRAAATYGRDVEAISHDALDRLAAHHWPGNVRELASTIEAAVMHAAGPTLRADDVLLDLPQHEKVPKARQPRALERFRLLDALRRASGNRSAAARLLGIGRATLYRRLAMLDAGESDRDP